MSAVRTPDLLARLLAHRTLGVAPREELAWLAARGAARSYRVGEVATHKGQPEEWLQILFSGHLGAHVDRGAGPRRLTGWRGGDVCGAMPYSRGGSPPGDTVAEEPIEMMVVHRDLFPEMVRACPRITALLVHAMLDRARYFTSSELHDEKLVSLGRLAAGLAHELNNPASAAARSTKLLAQALADADAAARALEAARLSDAQLASVDRVRALARPHAPPGSALERADREESLAAWLAARRLDDASASTLAATPVTLAALDSLATAIPAAAVDAALRSITSGCLVRALTSDIEISVSRIHDLVAAVKGFTHMDRAPTAEPTDLRQGVADTLAVLGSKLQAKSVAVEVRLAPDLPRVLAHGGELNQVWANLIDNAIDAVAPSGHIEVTAAHERERVVVRIIDDGAGIPPEIQARIFDPFFTTKPVGQGTGLGLDIARRLVQRQDGELDFQSRPGRTEFRVSLPFVTDAAESDLR
jgi:signal transduction histidine kinase